MLNQTTALGTISSKLAGVPVILEMTLIAIAANFNE
jgi:hypothetical protein